MKNKLVSTNLYALLPWLAALLLIIAAQNDAWTVSAVFLGAVVLPPLSLSCLRSVSLRMTVVFAVGGAILCTVGMPLISLGMLCFTLWFAGAVILRIFIEYTPDLFPILLIGGSIFLGLIAVCIVFMAREKLGVWDLQSIYTGIENTVLKTLDEVGAFYKTLPLTAEQIKTYTSYIDLAKQQIDYYVFRILLVAATLLALQYFWTLKAAQFACRNKNKIEVLSLSLFTVPKEIAVCYIILNIISLFVSGVYQFGFDLANDLMGFLFVLCGIGLIDVLLSRKMSATPRYIIKAVLLAAAVISKCFLLELVYIFLLCVGLFVSLRRRLVILRNKETKIMSNRKNKKSFTFQANDILAFLLPVLFIGLTLIAGIRWMAAAEAAALLVYLIYRLISRKRFNDQIYAYLHSMTEYLDEASRENLTSFPMPITLLDTKGNIIWYNDLFYELLKENDQQTLFGQNISQISEAIRPDKLADGTRRFNISYLGKYYTVYCMRQGKADQKDRFFVLYWMDDDKLKRENIRLKSEKLCLAYIVNDSYDEIPSDVSEMQRSNFVSRVDVAIRDMAKEIGGVVKKMEVDKYLLIFERKQLPKLEKNKFNILEQVKEITLTDGVHASLSIGISRADGPLKQVDLSAREALDMALARGGDQAALFTGEKYAFFGGKAQAAEKRKRVKVRIISEALATQINASDNVLIMGHRFADLDCMGAAIALAHCIKALSVPVQIVLNLKENLVSDLLESLSETEEYKEIFIDAAKAQKSIHDDTLLIIVDTHSVQYIESEKLYRSANRIALIDHHRKVTQGAIENTLIRFHEPNASSCCEMVTELIDSLNNIRIGKTEANALMAGILLDTKNFSERTGVRTFEAAAYLKGKGADTAEVQKYFKSDIDAYKKQLEIISLATQYGEHIMIAAYDKPAFDGIKIVAGKAADELLGLKGIGASFVLYHEDGMIYISARSEGEINVQTILEKMGGGGHRNAAGAQLTDSMEQTLDRLRQLIDSEQ